MKISSITLNDEIDTYYEVGMDDVKEIIFHKFYLVDNVFEVKFYGDRQSVKIPYHSVLLWR